jgi:hypothetical protein
MAALSVITDPSGSISVGIWRIGLSRVSSRCADSGSQLEAVTHSNDCLHTASAISIAAEPEPQVPYSA